MEYHSDNNNIGRGLFNKLPTQNENGENVLQQKEIGDSIKMELPDDDEGVNVFQGVLLKIEKEEYQLQMQYVDSQIINEDTLSQTSVVDNINDSNCGNVDNHDDTNDFKKIKNTMRHIIQKIHSTNKAINDKTIKNSDLSDSASKCESMHSIDHHKTKSFHYYDKDYCDTDDIDKESHHHHLHKYNLKLPNEIIKDRDKILKNYKEKKQNRFIINQSEQSKKYVINESVEIPFEKFNTTELETKQISYKIICLDESKKDPLCNRTDFPIQSIHAEANIILKTKIFQDIADDDILNTIKYDKLIIKFGNELSKTCPYHDMIQTNLRLLARFKWEFHKLDSEIVELKEVFKTQLFDKCVKAIGSVANWENSKMWSKTLMVIKNLTSLIKKCGELLQIELLFGCENLKKELDKFLFLYDLEIPKLFNRKTLEDHVNGKSTKVDMTAMEKCNKDKNDTKFRESGMEENNRGSMEDDESGVEKYENCMEYDESDDKNDIIVIDEDDEDGEDSKNDVAGKKEILNSSLRRSHKNSQHYRIGSNGEIEAKHSKFGDVHKLETNPNHQAQCLNATRKSSNLNKRTPQELKTRIFKKRKQK